MYSMRNATERVEMTYSTDRLPKDVAVSLLYGFAGAFVGGVLTCSEATREFAKEYPHDGQDALGGFYVGSLSAPLFGLLSTGVVFAIRYLRYRKLVRLEGEKAFEAELLAARGSK